MKSPQSNDGTQSHTQEPEELQIDSALTDTVSVKSKKGDPLAHVGADMPPVQQHAIDAERKKEADAATQLDAQQAVAPGFDPAIHESRDGQPVLTKDGKPRRKRGGAGKLKGLPPAGGSASGPAPAAAQPEVSQAALNAQFQAAAETATGLTLMGGQIAFGDAGAPIKRKIAEGQEIDERKGLTEAYFKYFKSKDISDIPPGLALCVVVLGYAIPRFQMPEAQPRIQKWKMVAYGWYLKFKSWRAGPQAKRVTPEVERNPDESGE